MRAHCSQADIIQLSPNPWLLYTRVAQGGGGIRPGRHSVDACWMLVGG